MVDAYFETRDDAWFLPTHHARGPWQLDACHAGPPTALVVRALERLLPDRPLARVTVDLVRPIPMSGFAVTATIQREGRSVATTEARIHAGDRTFARASAVHVRRLDDLEVASAEFAVPDFAASTPGPFPLVGKRHPLPAFPASTEVRYDPGSRPFGGPTTLWMRTVPVLAGEEPTGWQRLCPLADCGNGISFNLPLDRLQFTNVDLTIAVHREPVGEWIGSSAMSHWQPTGVGLADAVLFDGHGPVGRAVQTLLLDRPPRVSRPPTL